MTLFEVLPCDRGGMRQRGMHHFQAGQSGVVACIYCGKRGPSEPIKVTYAQPGSGS